jgi:hypothetical protein
MGFGRATSARPSFAAIFAPAPDRRGFKPPSTDRLSLEGDSHVADYLLDEWDEGESSHWINHTIPVFAVHKAA